MTAVEWLVQQLVDRQNGRAYGSNLDEIFQQALEMEKEQIIDAATWGALQETGEQYYNETYKKN